MYGSALPVARASALLLLLLATSAPRSIARVVHAHPRDTATAGDDVLISPRITALKKELDAGNKSALASFWEHITAQGTPMVERIQGEERYLLVTFLWRAAGETRNVAVISGLFDMEPAKGVMERLPDTDLWFKSYRVRSDARFTYWISPNDSLAPLTNVTSDEDYLARAITWQKDPFNKKQFFGSPSVCSVVELPGAPPQPWISRVAGRPSGESKLVRLKSAILNNERNVWVYTPPGYNAAAKPYGLIVIFDGMAYALLVPTPVILDNMLAEGAIPPLVAVILGNPTADSRNSEMPCNTAFADFLAKEVVPWARRNYNVTSDAAQTIVAGSSYGGLAAGFAGFKHSEVFGNVLSQSGSYWWKPDGDAEHESFARQIATSPKLPVRFYLGVGLLESGPTPGDGPSMVIANRHLRDVLIAKGYFVHYCEFNGGHEYLNWRGTFSDGLIALIGKRAR